MRTIWKFHLHVGMNEIWAPGDASPLTVQMQNGAMLLWTTVDTDETKRPFRVLIVGTGQELPDIPASFLGTVQDRTDYGFLVWHAFLVPLSTT